VCAKGGGRFAGRVHAAMFWGQPRGGSHEDGSDGKETVGGTRTEWVDERQLSDACSPEWVDGAYPTMLVRPTGSMGGNSQTLFRFGRLDGVH